MSSRQAACEPCRRAKVACDHKQPACTRCLQKHGAPACTYRASPFRKRKSNGASVAIDPPSQGSPLREWSPENTATTRNPYPNPGHFGSSSHVAIFNQIHLEGNSFPDSPLVPSFAMQGSHARSIDLDPITSHGADMLKKVFNRFNLTAMKDLVVFWLAKGVSLALAEPFVKRCADTMDYVTTKLLSDNENWHLELASHLLRNSDRPLKHNEESTFSNFADQFCERNVRWETLGIFLSAVIRASFDIPFFPSLYATENGRNELQRVGTRLSACSLEICLSLDCLNDIQLIFQYENFIVHSYVYGDQSLHSWRSLGDVIASTFALGYHENIQIKHDVPFFLAELRRTAFARIYSADKNVAIFLGRPPRMSKRFSCFQIPSSRAGSETDTVGPGDQIQIHDWDPGAEINYKAETRWSALCASIKEDILELLYDQDRTHDTQKASEIAGRAEAQWQALPARFRLDGCLGQCTQAPFERDFLASTRLNHLHVQFLLRLALSSHLADPDTTIVEISRQILALVVETVLLRDQLANSGTGLIWKIAHYGLPAAGIILLATLKLHKTSNILRMSQFRVWQDLSVLVAEVQIGSIVQLGEPNYPLLSKATQTIQLFLESAGTREELNSSETLTGQQGADGFEDWFPSLPPDPWNLEIEFWENLAEHPFLSGGGSTFQSLPSVTE